MAAVESKPSFMEDGVLKPEAVNEPSDYQVLVGQKCVTVAAVVSIVYTDGFLWFYGVGGLIEAFNASKVTSFRPKEADEDQ
jgi:hypothetical protein